MKMSYYSFFAGFCSQRLVVMSVFGTWRNLQHLAACQRQLMARGSLWYSTFK